MVANLRAGGRHFMKRFGWVTDIHLNFLEPEALQAYHDLLRNQKLDGVLISGDIAEAPSVAGFLLGLRRGLGIPIYFVLGNHDYYFSSLQAVHERIRALCAESEGDHVALRRAHRYALGEHRAH